MNTVTHTGFINNADKSTGATLSINGNCFSASTRVDGWKAPRYEEPIMVWYCRASNEWNQSAFVTFEARTLKALVRKLQNHPYRLVK